MSIKDYSAGLKAALQDAEQADLFCHYDDPDDDIINPFLFDDSGFFEDTTLDYLDGQIFIDDDYPF